jgi:prepilin-type N-terminal cleavage/methylation domain-containing protein
MRRARGFTLPELVVSLAAVGAFGAAITSIVLRVRDEEKVAAGREADLESLRRVARLVEADVRGGLDLDAAGWRLVGDVLSRQGAVVARSIARFDARADGDCVRVSLAVEPRVVDGPRGEASLEWVVRARAGAPAGGGR